MNSILGKGFSYQRRIIQPDGRVIQLPEAHNLVPLEGIQFVANLILGSGSMNANWYAFIFEGNYIPDNASSAADLPGVIGECTAYASTVRPTWGGQFDGSSLITNPVDIQFAMNQDKVLYGAGIVSSSTKGGNGGFLLSIARFPSPEEVKSGATFVLTADLPIMSTDI
jgi:hypothetical protein